MSGGPYLTNPHALARFVIGELGYTSKLVSGGLPSTPEATPEQTKLVAKRLASLPKVEREIAWLLFAENCSIERVGEFVGKTPKEVAVIARRIKRRARAGEPLARSVAECGTTAGYHKHRRQGEATCQPCKDAQAAYGRRGRSPRTKPVCGTHGGYYGHRRKHEPACEACILALREHRRAKRVGSRVAP